MKPPYYAVIFTNTQTETLQGYAEMAETMEALAQQQPGYLGMEHARSEMGITISYWETLEDIAHWKANLNHQEAQQLGKAQWYKNYTVRICKVEREYRFEK
ncbi:MAG: antibiotic biosynthesis monooxygenase [Flavobacteriaceae bacterium]